MGDFVNPIVAPLLGLLVLAAVVVVGWRLASRGPSRMGRALATVGGGIVAVWILGMLVQACSAPAASPTGAPVSNR